MIRIIKITIAVIALLLIIIGIYMMINGSLEMYPTIEQQEKVNITGTAFVIVGVILGVIVKNH